MADDDSPDEILNRADALLRRYRASNAGKTPADIPVLTDIIGAENIPTLTEEFSATPSTTTQAGVSVETPAPMPETTAAASLEESIYRKLRQELSRELREGLLPLEAELALDQALHKVSADLQDDIRRIVRATVEQVLNEKNTDKPV